MLKHKQFNMVDAHLNGGNDLDLDLDFKLDKLLRAMILSKIKFVSSDVYRLSIHFPSFANKANFFLGMVLRGFGDDSEVFMTGSIFELAYR